MLKLTKKKLILFSITILIIILVIFIFFPYQLPRTLCISDSSCKCFFNKYTHDYQCTNIFWRPAGEPVEHYTFALPLSLNRTCFDDCYGVTGNQEECKEACFVNHIPVPPECGCVDFHCKETYTEYPEYYCTVDGKNYSRNEYLDLQYELTPDRRLIKKDIGFDPVKEQYIDCKCHPKQKDKFVIFMKEDSKFYSEELKTKLEQYQEAVKSDVNIESIGILFFEGSSYEFREKLHDLYLNQDVGYALLIGNDLLEMLDDSHYIGNKTSLAFRRFSLSFGELGCPSIAVSVLPVPNSEVNKQKEFLSEQIDNYIKFHEDPETYLNKFSRSYIRIVNLDASIDYTVFDASSPDIEPDIKYYWDLPKRDILSSDPELKSEIRNEKPMILEVMGHGWARVLAWQVIPNASPFYPNSPFSPGQDPDTMGNTDEWLDFTKDFTPSVLTTVEACGSSIIDDYDSGEHGSYLFEFCCWPQAMLKSGALAYIGRANTRIYDFTDSDFFGQALRKNIIEAEYFGDLFAHI